MTRVAVNVYVSPASEPRLDCVLAHPQSHARLTQASSMNCPNQVAHIKHSWCTCCAERYSFKKTCANECVHLTHGRIQYKLPFYISKCSPFHFILPKSVIVTNELGLRKKFRKIKKSLVRVNKPSGNAPLVIFTFLSRCVGKQTTSYAHDPRSDNGEPAGDSERVEHGDHEAIDASDWNSRYGCQKAYQHDWKEFLRSIGGRLGFTVSLVIKRKR